MMLKVVLTNLIVVASTFSTNCVLISQRSANRESSLFMSSNEKDGFVSRKEVFKKAAAFSFAFVAAPKPAALALDRFPSDYEIVKEQRTIVDKLDINNAPVADYMQYPGMYPTIAGKIANNGPYASFQDVFKLELLTAAEKDKIKTYSHVLTATTATGLDTMRGRDPYRRSFNK